MAAPQRDVFLEQVEQVCVFLNSSEVMWRSYRAKRLHEHEYGSPLERVFAMWFREFQESINYAEPFTLDSQVQVSCETKKYHLDFQVIGHIGWEAFPLMLAVELDGHTYHERTRAQVASRDSRDRDLQNAGWRVFHFSYGELTEGAVDCVTSVIAAGEGMLSDIQRTL